MGLKRARNLVRRESAEMSIAILERWKRRLVTGEKVDDGTFKMEVEILRVAGAHSPKESLSASLSLSAELAAQADEAGDIIEELSADAILASRDRFVDAHGPERMEKIVQGLFHRDRAEALAPLGLDVSATAPDVIVEAARRFVANKVGLPGNTTLADVSIELQALQAAGDPRTEVLHKIVNEAAKIAFENRPRPEPEPDPVTELIEQTAAPAASDVAERTRDDDGRDVSIIEPPGGHLADRAVLPEALQHKPVDPDDKADRRARNVVQDRDHW
jgi:hypothetical protein